MGMHEMTYALFAGERPTSIFEVGCGSGFYLQDYGGMKKYGGIDIVPSSVYISQQVLPAQKENFVIWDATQDNWPFEDNSFDIVFTVGTLLLIPNPYIALKEMIRIAKDSVILAEYQDDSKSDFGAQGDIPQPKDVYDLRIYRDYKKIFEKMNLKWEQKSSCNNKAIFKISL